MSSMLAAGVALAFRSSFNSFKDVQQRCQMMNGARGGLQQITADISASDSAVPYDPIASIAAAETSEFNAQVIPGNPTAGLPSVGGAGVLGIRLLKTHADSRDPGASAANPVIITYWLDAPSRTLYMTRRTSSAAPTPFPVCTFVQSMSIYMQPLYVPSNPAANAAPSVVCGRVVVTATLASADADGERIRGNGKQELTLTFAEVAMPRRIFPGI